MALQQGHMQYGFKYMCVCVFKVGRSFVCVGIQCEGPILLTWIYYNPIMDKWLFINIHYKEWNEITSPTAPLIFLWMDK